MTFFTGNSLAAYLKDFVFLEETENLPPFLSGDGKTRTEFIRAGGADIPLYINEFWTSRQRQASSVHEISYRACFKPQLPRFLIELLTEAGDTVYDPFSGRGTTVIEAGLLNRRVIANDVNPLSRILAEPRFFPPSVDDLSVRLAEIPMDPGARAELDLSMFYHPDTEAEIVSIRDYLARRQAGGLEDALDRWIRMVATNRLTGHSKGFFSVYTLPPNQAVSRESQRQINEKRNQKPPYRDTKAIIRKKSISLLRNLSAVQAENLLRAGTTAMFLSGDAGKTSEIESGSVQLLVTSPPFLDIVQYSKDNWLRCWFNSIDDSAIAANITMARKVEEWSTVMQYAFKEFFRIIRPGGWVCFEVGEVRNGKVNLDEAIAPIGIEAGFACEGILVNMQEFTKTSNIWGVKNNAGGTNTNRIVLFHKKHA